MREFSMLDKIDEDIVDENGITYRLCSYCERFQTYDSFPNHYGFSCGKGRMCKDCKNYYYKRKRQDNKDRIKGTQK